ncbi:hypothetical protein E4H04_13120 [Candidatus Bathyarchaeota archaeon]|nr:MAG: hypothetical protein E4H04_13120 [Candidatus Bathyarchaeota archaeon]
MLRAEQQTPILHNQVSPRVFKKNDELLAEKQEIKRGADPVTMSKRPDSWTNRAKKALEAPVR